ncbi:hypothetical protein GGR53DRAFT_479642 [Hypoxylon sp. FL1150]|nr:hypothetical protein GGR53DRAFT_479642 [Hypoxylon sp. FL1150]
MEKYSQFRDRGTGISPFLPSTTPASTFSTLWRSVLFLCRLPFFLTYSAVFFLVLDHLPSFIIPQVGRKLLLWTLLGIPGIWWVDLQLDGVKRGSLSQQPSSRFPNARSVIAAQFTSPVDALYLAAIFDPIFTVSYPSTRKVRRVSLLGAILHALAPPPTRGPPPSATGLTTLRALVEQNPHRVVAVFPEMTTTNGKGILPLSPSLLATPPDARIFPVSMRYTLPDITTPVPGEYLGFLWNLLSRPKHLIRVRIAEGVTNNAVALTNGVGPASHAPERANDDSAEDLTPEEAVLLGRIGEALSRLARNKRVGLTLRDKAAFVELWRKGRK